jgi:hypothetical protein
MVDRLQRIGGSACQQVRHLIPAALLMLVSSLRLHTVGCRAIIGAEMIAVLSGPG